MATNLHAHISSEATGCDGRVGYDYIVSLNESELAEHAKADGINDFHDLNFKSRVLGNAVSFHADSRITMSESGFVCVEETDEGYRRVDATWCEDEDCDPNTASQYDQYAELSGY